MTATLRRCRLMRPLRVLAIALLTGSAGWAPLFGQLAYDPGRLRQLAEQNYGTTGARRLEQWQKLLGELPAETISATLRQVNETLNQSVRFTSDSETWQQEDYWATPLQTLARGEGDCEDFTIAKYVTLLLAGVPADNLRLVYVRARIGLPGSGISQAHMVLAYYPEPTSDPLVLDNLIDDILPASQRNDLQPVFSFNGDGLWVGGGRNPASREPLARLSRWRDVLHRMREEGFTGTHLK